MLVRVREAMERAFGDRLTQVWEPDGLGFEPWYSIIRPFLESLEASARLFHPSSTSMRC